MTSPGIRMSAGALVMALALAACSADEGDDTDDGVRPEPGVSPTAVDDAPLVRVLEAGSEPRRELRLTAEDGARTSSSVVLDQEVDNDGRVNDTPPITFPFDTEVTGTADDEITTMQTYGAAEVDPDSAQAGQITEALGPVAGSTGTITQRPDGAVADSSLDLADDAPAAGTLAEVRDQVQALSPVFPTDEVGSGATWTVTSVVDVDGATVDQTATYTLESIEDDAYVVGVTVSRDYRAGTVEGVELTQGAGTLSGRFEGSLTATLPARASADATTTVTYLVGEAATEARTTIRARLTSG